MFGFILLDTTLEVPLGYVLGCIGFSLGLLTEYYLTWQQSRELKRYIAYLERKIEEDSKEATRKVLSYKTATIRLHEKMQKDKEMAMKDVRQMRHDVLMYKDVANGEMARLMRQGDEEVETQTETVHVYAMEDLKKIDENMSAMAMQVVRLGAELVHKEIAMQKMKREMDEELGNMEFQLTDKDLEIKIKSTHLEFLKSSIDVQRQCYQRIMELEPTTTECRAPAAAAGPVAEA